MHLFSLFIYSQGYGGVACLMYFFLPLSHSLALCTFPSLLHTNTKVYTHTHTHTHAHTHIMYTHTYSNLYIVIGYLEWASLEVALKWNDSEEAGRDGRG